MSSGEERRLGRAKNAALTFLQSKLIVPKIYLSAEWDGQMVDLLAIERDGVGDVHAVLFFASKYLKDEGPDTVDQLHEANALIDRFATIPAQYKYVAAVGNDLRTLKNKMGFPLRSTLKKWNGFAMPPELAEKSFSPDGLGRIGFLSIDPSAGDDSGVWLDVKPERFRAKVATLASEYVRLHEADWEIRQ